MKKISLRFRIAILTSILIAITSLTMNFFMNKTAYFYIDSLGGYVDNIENKKDLYINIDKDKIDDFQNTFSDQVTSSKDNFSKKAWLITSLVTIFGGIISYFLSGKFLEPLDKFSRQIEQIKLKNITDYEVKENPIKEFQKLTTSFNQMLERLNESYKSEREFTARAAHELRTPLTIINSQIDLFEEKNMEEKEVNDLMTMIKNESDRLSKLVTSLLNLSELRSVSRNEKIELSSLIEEAIQDLSFISDKKDIKIENNCKEIYIEGSDILIYRAFYNLIENAIKYNKECGYIKIYSKIKGDFAEIFVEDNGIGIDFKEKENIFKAFYRIEGNEEKGSGLGLSLVKETIKIHGGEIQVLNKEKGCLIKVSLPISNL
ncbi:HAMP domain-containing sensor histidine kinase [Anaerococcus hydrogenalis]|uniref:histidine kinase n=1 Tax=Anaerococcus hydrogenalis TaxID=33029 RepID=A0A2N6UJW4_9FIRM|nr:HAMP domain-containing sensor histidine kinase [Anaerococcus hydrogenalis]MDK7695064.1 HAMP domain-containing sensor histidine kinase [Anaerococcus hydrogenalis]MDK7696961.1 HAMP domain-containing sensor histidine kinase [Anaerococcus hydrogenalis]MDK7708091.1 HAMP domain-containing sensor histidine kinase [Anaerococcus hydrogenalis]PMC81953.1 sensor histidine kinase [Anaerococcus hydrogenalis]